MARARAALGAAVGVGALAFEVAGVLRDAAAERVAQVTWCAAMGCDGQWHRTTTCHVKVCRWCRRELGRWFPPR
jgi:hypothetical protein